MALPPVAPLEAPPSRNREPVAPVWHTAIFLLALLVLVPVQAHQQPKLENMQPASRLTLYAGQIVFELFIFAYVWLLGLKLTGTRIRDLIGGRWASLQDVLRDVGAAVVFWLIVIVVLSGLQRIVGENTAGLKTIKSLLPQTPVELAVWVALCVIAGFCEELVFRGYLQRQFLAYTKRVDLAIILQAVFFGMAHTYQGAKGVVVISVYGAMFGILAVVKRSLRPGMIQHAGQDTFSGIVGSLLARRHYF